MLYNSPKNNLALDAEDELQDQYPRIFCVILDNLTKVFYKDVQKTFSKPLIFVSIAKQKGDICIAFPASSLSSSSSAV